MPRFLINATLIEKQEHELLIDANSEEEAIRKVEEGEFDPDISKCRGTSNGYDISVEENADITCEGRVADDAQLYEDESPEIIEDAALQD